MKRRGYRIVTLLFTVGVLVACSQKRYTVSNIDSSRIEMDSTWDSPLNLEVEKKIIEYKVQLESRMNVVLGEAAETMTASLPQSLLTNLTADVMKQSGARITGQPIDFAVMNVHGHRSVLNQGAITVGSLFEIYSFDNILVVIELNGKDVQDLFAAYAGNGGEGLSSGVQLKVKNKKIESLKIGGQPVDPGKTYRIATIDYLAEGNGIMKSLTKASKYTDTGIALRDVMIDYVKECTAKGEKIDSSLDDRIVIEKD